MAQYHFQTFAQKITNGNCTSGVHHGSILTTNFTSHFNALQSKFEKVFFEKEEPKESFRNPLLINSSMLFDTRLSIAEELVPFTTLTSSPKTKLPPILSYPHYPKSNA